MDVCGNTKWPNVLAVEGPGERTEVGAGSQKKKKRKEEIRPMNFPKWGKETRKK